MNRRLAAGTAAAVAAASMLFAGGSGAAVTRHDANGTVLLDGAPAFPIVLAKGPPRDGTTPAGADAIAEVVGAGATFLKVGPATTVWTAADIEDARLWDAAAAAHGAYTWINLSTLSQAQPGSAKDTLLAQVIGTLKGDAAGSRAIGMWKGADEPWWSGFSPATLQLAYCRATSRGDAGWCGGEPWLDQDHLWVTIEAPRGTAADLAPYTAVTDAHGVDIYPVTYANPTPDLHQVGAWTNTVASITPNHAVWTTLQVCASGSYDGSGHFVLPTRAQERYMIYDAIVNGARNLAFYGGNNPNCWNATDSAHGWNWTFWGDVLKGLIQEINGISPLAPALVNTASNRVLTTGDGTTQAISRNGAASDELWIVAARSGTGTQPVTISGLPPTVTTGSVYAEGRSVPVVNGSLTDSFDQWGVHVYHLTVPPAPAPAISSFTPTSGPAGTTVAISGTNLGGATAVTFNRVAAAFTVTSATQLTATVPAGATTGPVAVTASGGTAASAASFIVTTPPPPETTIDAAAAGTFSFHGSPGAIRFECAVDGGAFIPCTSPVAYSLPPGSHTFAVRALDVSGTPDPTPATAAWTVETPPAPPPAPPAGGTGPAPAPQAPPPVVETPPAPAPQPPPPDQPARRPQATSGSDRIVGTPGRDVLRGLAGKDAIFGLAGNDVLDGGSGDDVVDGGAGSDTIYGGNGHDVLRGGPGNDVLRAHDRTRDRIACGRGMDSVLADRVDLVARDCERVTRLR